MRRACAGKVLSGRSPSLTSPLQPDRAAICLRAGQYPGQPRQQGAFTAAAWPHQGQYLAGGHLQGGQREQQIFIKVKPKRRGAQHMAVSIVRVHREPPPLERRIDPRRQPECQQIDNERQQQLQQAVEPRQPPV